MLLKSILNSIIYKNTKFVSFGVRFSTKPTFKHKIFQEEIIKLPNHEINYLKVGRGPHRVFCVSSVIGTIWSDFKKQIEKFDLDKFTLVVWDTPGIGKSTILDYREVDIFSSKADVAYEFMKALDIPKYSLMGWSKGGNASLLLASRHPDVVNKVVAWGTSSFLYPHEMKYYESMKNLNTWPQSMRDKMIKLYGEKVLMANVNYLIESMEMLQYAHRTYCDEIKRVKCPTLLLHGGKDPITDIRHLKYLHSLIKDSRTHWYPDGEHDIHIKYADDFNKRVQEFLLME